MYPALIRFKVEPEVNSFARIVTEQQGIHRNSLGLGSLPALYRCLWIVCVPHFLHPNSCCMWQWDHLVGFPLGEKMMTTIMAQLTMGDVDIKTAEKKNETTTTTANKKNNTREHHQQPDGRNNNNKPHNNGTYIMRKTRHSTAVMFQFINNILYSCRRAKIAAI